MTEERKPPPLPRRVTRDITRDGLDPDEVYVPPVDTERSSPRMPIIPKAPKTPPEPFQLLKGRESSYIELSAQIGEVRQISHEVLAVQRKTNLQIDHIGQVVNQRFDLFHEELALLRALVTGDHGPRLAKTEQGLDAVEKSLGGKAKDAAVAGSKLAWSGGATFTMAALIARMLGKKFPAFAEAIESLLGAAGL